MSTPPKQQRYFSGQPLERDPSRPLPGEMSGKRKRDLRRAAFGMVAFFVGSLFGYWMAPESSDSAAAKNAELLELLHSAEQRNTRLEELLAEARQDVPRISSGKTLDKIRRKHLKEGKARAAALKRAGAQAASELLVWFVKRWNGLLLLPQANDRTERRAATLSLLVGGMSRNLDAQSYVRWQAGFFDSPWLAELHYDADGDGLPGKRKRANTKDGFANVSICQIAMALNQSVTDAQILVMPDMQCDRPRARMSLFLQGRTFDDAITEFIAAAKDHGYLVRQSRRKGIRMVLVASGGT